MATLKKTGQKTALKKRPASPPSGKKAITAKATAKQKKTGRTVTESQKTGKGEKTAFSRKTQKRPVASLPVKKKPAKGAPESQQERLALLRKELHKRKEEILREAKLEISKYLSGENRQLVDTALDEGDWAVVDINEDISLRMLSTHRAVLHDIDEAIRKIGEGTYGICEECGVEISTKRLRILPAAVLCVDCQENKEKLAGLIRQETL